MLLAVKRNARGGSYSSRLPIVPSGSNETTSDGAKARCGGGLPQSPWILESDGLNPI